MCYGSQRLPPSGDEITPSTVRARPPAAAVNTEVVESLRLRLAETEARLQQARAREAELSKKLFEMKRFVSVMEILETYLKQRFLDQQQQLSILISQKSPILGLQGVNNNARIAIQIGPSMVGSKGLYQHLFA